MAHPFQNQLLLEDAVRITGPAAFNIMLKPAGSLCNLGCAYCYARTAITWTRPTSTAARSPG